NLRGHVLANLVRILVRVSLAYPIDRRPRLLVLPGEPAVIVGTNDHGDGTASLLDDDRLASVVNHSQKIAKVGPRFPSRHASRRHSPTPLPPVCHRNVHNASLDLRASPSHQRAYSRQLSVRLPEGGP